MDFFDLKNQQGPSERVQRFGRRTADFYNSLNAADPTPSYTSIPDTNLVRKNDLFLKPMREYVEMPEQQETSGLPPYFIRPFVPPDLPILQYREEIVDTIKGNMVTIITAPTGSGKSTQVPQYILDDEYRTEQRHCKIVVTQPRRVAAISLANRVLSERNLDPLGSELQQGTLVGYQIGMDKKVNEDTRLVYMTTGVLLRKLINAQTLKEFTHIILDEVHERDKDTDFLLLLIKRMLCRTPLIQVRIVVMSATVDANKFSQYFRTLHCQVPCPAPIIPIKEQMFSVTVFYLDDIRQSLGMDSDTDDGPEDYSEPSTISDKIYKTAKELIKFFDQVDLMDPDEVSSGASIRGSVLVFLPGIFEIESMQQVLKSDSCSETYDIICLHSTIPRQYQMRVFEEPQPGRRKVILSTNIAESSITVPDIKYVIDFCLSKELYADSGSGMSSLKYVWAPKSSLDQRKGRAGRVSRGRCYRLIYKNFLKELNDFTTPEMQRCSVEQLILWCKMLNIGDPEEVLSYALDPPDLNKLREGALLLLEVGALVLPKGCIGNPMEQNLTFLGQVMGSMPLDVRLSRLIMFGLVFDVLGEAVIMAACLSLPAFLEVPYSNKEQKLLSYVSRMRKAKGTFSDPIMMLNVYNEWYELYAKENKSKAREYCKINFINYNRICEVAGLVQDLYNCLRQLNIPDHLSRKRENSYTATLSQYELILNLKLALAGANYPFYYVQNKAFLDRENCMKTFGSKSPADTIMYTGMRLNVTSNSELERKYRQDVSSFFKDVFDPVKRLTLESNRLYVTFDMISESTVCKSVYYSLKMKQIRGFRLTLHSKRDSHLPVASVKTFKLKGESELINVTVTYVESPTRFFVQVQEPTIRGNFDELHQVLQDEVKDPTRVAASELRENMYGLAYFEEHSERILYRVRALQITSNFQVKVNYLDFGNSKWINGNMFFNIPQKFLWGSPFQAVECCIEGICPQMDSRSLCSSETWDRRFVDELRPILENKHFSAKVHYLLNNVLHLDLYDGPNSLKQYLVGNKKFPVSVALDNYRTDYAKLQGGTDLRLEVVEAPSETDQRHNQHFQPEKCELSGPTSPYEVEHCGLNNTARSYRTIVDQNSVCSISVCTNPSDDFTEMLSASTVSLSGTGCRVQLRGTTQHPPIRGFPDMVMLLFSPKVQLHTSPSRLNYVGCVAGLGIDERGDPLWPDHDLQVTFDHRVLSSDIDLINNIRLTISNILTADDDNPSKIKFIESQIKIYQDKIKSYVRKLREGLNKRQRSISHHETLIYGWRPDNYTHNSLELFPDNYGGENEDVLRPHSTLFYMDRSENYLQIEPSCKSKDFPITEKRVKKLQRYTHKLREETSSNEGVYRECRLCKQTFDKFRQLAAHLDSDAHLTELRRLDYWPGPR
ncbi:hypothetical protein ACHWQZ_G017059 [Mnemiopsis leidyi]